MIFKIPLADMFRNMPITDELVQYYAGKPVLDQDNNQAGVLRMIDLKTYIGYVDIDDECLKHNDTIYRLAIRNDTKKEGERK